MTSKLISPTQKLKLEITTWEVIDVYFPFSEYKILIKINKVLNDYVFNMYLVIMEK